MPKHIARQMPARFVELSSALVLLVSLAGPAASDDLAKAGDPAPLGFSAARLGRIASWYRERGTAEVPGAVVAIARNGKTAYLEAMGFQDRAKTVAMRPDSIFLIGSMSKQITSVAAMMLVDDGKLDLDALVARCRSPPSTPTRPTASPNIGRCRRSGQ